MSNNNAIDETNPEEIIAKYKTMNAECQQIASKVSELQMDKDEHRLALETLAKLDSDRKAFRLIGGVLVEKTVGEILPTVSQNLEGIKQIIATLEENLKNKDSETKAFKEKHQIMTQAERAAMMRNNSRQQART